MQDVEARIWPVDRVCAARNRAEPAGVVAGQGIASSPGARAVMPERFGAAVQEPASHNILNELFLNLYRQSG